jgi:hypothetical protein
VTSLRYCQMMKVLNQERHDLIRGQRHVLKRIIIQGTPEIGAGSSRHPVQTHYCCGQATQSAGSRQLSSSVTVTGGLGNTTWFGGGFRRTIHGARVNPDARQRVASVRGNAWKGVGLYWMRKGKGLRYTLNPIN